MQFKSVISLLIVISLIVSAAAIPTMIPTIQPTINPAALDSFLCDIPGINLLITDCPESMGGQGPAGPPEEGNTTILNFWNLTTGGGNFSAVSNVTNFFNVYNSEMNQTAGPQGIEGIQGEQGPQGDTGAIPDSSQFLFQNLSRKVTGEYLLKSSDNSFLMIGGGAIPSTGGGLWLFGKNYGWAYDGGWYASVVNTSGWPIPVFAVTGNTETPFINLLTHPISNIANPISAQDAATKNYVDTQIGSLPFQTYAGNPTNNLVPTAINGYCTDTTNHDLYIATTGLSSGWRKFTRAA